MRATTWLIQDWFSVGVDRIEMAFIDLLSPELWLNVESFLDCDLGDEILAAMIE